MDTETISQEDSKINTEVIGWIGLADDDYVAARLLINNALLVQGAILSVTAIEKYLKMVHKIRRLSFPRRDPHNLLDLYNSVKSKGLDMGLNVDYLALLVKVYRMRYPDKIEADFNFVLNQAKLLAALDESVYAIRHRLVVVSTQPEEKRESKFEYWISSNYNHLMRMNHCYCAEVKRENLFKNPSIYREVRFVKGKTWMEAGYTAAVEDDSVYNLEGLRPGETDRVFHFQKAPIDMS